MDVDKVIFVIVDEDEAVNDNSEVTDPTLQSEEDPNIVEPKEPWRRHQLLMYKIPAVKRELWVEILRIYKQPRYLELNLGHHCWENRM